MYRPLKHSGARALLWLVLAALALPPALAWATPKTTQRTKQKAAAEASRADIAARLARLKSEVVRTEDQKDDAADTLAESEEAISNANRQLLELSEEQISTNARLAALSQEQLRLAAVVEAQKKQLSTLLREHYVAGQEDRLKLLLSGDNPNRINRDLQLMAYVSQARAKLLASLRVNLAAVESNQQKEQNAKAELDEIAQEESDQKALLEKEKARRAALLVQLSKKLAEQRKQIVVDKLGKLIKEQAEAAAAEKRRREALAAARKAKAEAAALARAQAKAEKERLAREAVKAGKPPPPIKPDPVEPERPALAGQTPEDQGDPDAGRPPDIALGPAAPEGAFRSLKGKLRSPVNGKLASRFGAKRDGGPSWKGVFLQAAEGSDVRAVAAGRVVFASWMRGFGNLIIVDHGSEYLSIYGNNQSLLKRAGDAVKGGDPIASAGNTGGSEDSGLYFELRHRGAAFDPASWVSF